MQVYQRFVFSPVIYDEVEEFKNAVLYPFKRRKNELKGMNPKLNSDGNLLWQKINIKKNLVCYDNQWYSDLIFWKKLGCTNLDDDSLYKYNKIKYSDSHLELQ